MYKKIKIICIVVALFTGTVINAQAATHSHTDDCYNGTKHIHNKASNCHTYSRYNQTCPQCKGTGYNICEDCESRGEVLSSCGGTWVFYKDRSGGSSVVTTPSGAIYSGCVYHVYKCNSCGAEIDHSVTGGDSYTGNSGTIYLNGFTATSDMLHRIRCSTCYGSGHLESICYYCSGSKVTTRTCVNCGGDYTKADCTKCVGGKATVTGTCSVSTLSKSQVGAQPWSQSQASGTYYYYKVYCMGCSRNWSFTHNVGSSIGGSINEVTFDNINVKTTYCSVKPDANNFLDYINTNVIKHQTNGGVCDNCSGTSYVTCPACTNGIQYLQKLCTKRNGVFYESNGAVAKAICDKKINKITVKNKTQTVVK